MKVLPNVCMVLWYETAFTCIYCIYCTYCYLYCRWLARTMSWCCCCICKPTWNKFYLILSYFILSYLILSYLILSYHMRLNVAFPWYKHRNTHDVRPVETTRSDILTFSFKNMRLKVSVVCEMFAILSRPQCVKFIQIQWMPLANEILRGFSLNVFGLILEASFINFLHI